MQLRAAALFTSGIVVIIMGILAFSMCVQLMMARELAMAFLAYFASLIIFVSGTYIIHDGYVALDDGESHSHCQHTSPQDDLDYRIL
jgi:hypothetical protein